MEETTNRIDTISVNTARVLATDAVQKAKPGHPGLPLGAAIVSFELWTKHMNRNPKNPGRENRGCSILSGGHGSTPPYSLLHLFDCGLTKEGTMNFRQMGSLTPGHPEHGCTVGVEVTADSLGTGIGVVIGTAMAGSYLAAVFNRDGYPAADHYTYVLGSDGCMMGDISPEAFSPVGALGLGKLIVLCDSNRIPIGGSTDITFTENMQKCMEAFGLQLVTVEDGNDLDAIDKAIEEAKADTAHPSFTTARTQIGYGCPTKQGKVSTHDGLLGDDNAKAMKEFLNQPPMEPFYVPGETYTNYEAYVGRGVETEEKWDVLFVGYCKEYPETKELWDKFYNPNLTNNVYDSEDYWVFGGKPDVTRSLSGKQLQRPKNLMSNLVGGAVDLAPSTKAYMADMGDPPKDGYVGRNLRFSVRELTMSTIGNGSMLHGGLRAFMSASFMFNDYTRPMVRLSTLMDAPLTLILTHDSVGVGENGPTHEPVEQLAILYAMPNFHVYHSADATEIATVQYSAVSPKKTPTALVLTGQNLPQLAGSSREVLKGACILEDSTGEVLDAVIIATGSKIELTVSAKAESAKEGVDMRVVSASNTDVFEGRPKDYKGKVLPKAVRKRVTVEALGDFGQGRHVDLDGVTVAMKGFGASASTGRLFKRFGFAVKDVVAAVKSL